jgi:hypothetical protein
MWIIINISIVLILIFLFVIWAGKKWKTIKPLIYEDDEEQNKQEKQEGISHHLSTDKWKERFHTSFFQTFKKLEKIKGKEARAAVETLEQLKMNFDQLLTEKTHELTLKIVETGALQSILLNVGGIFIYILVFPGLHDQATLLKRYPPFMRGWVYHMEELRKVLKIDSAKSDWVQLMLFLSPNFREGTMHLAFQNSNFNLLPVDLLDKSETKEARGILYESRQVF